MTVGRLLPSLFHRVTGKNARLVSTGNGQLSTRTRVILLWATPVGLRPNRAAPGINSVALLPAQSGIT